MTRWVSFIVALAAAVALAAFAVVRGTWAVGGSDSSCYALMAQAFATGHLQPTTPLAVDAPWPNPGLTFAPGGFLPSAIRPDGAVPICAPGLSLLMAPLAAAFGQDAIFWLTPVAAAVLVLCAFALARQLAGGMAGATAAVLTATSPIVLYQSVQPMNDIVAAALWMAALAFANASGTAGVLAGLAILVRPNLAPLALVLAAVPFIRPATTEQRVRAMALVGAGALPGVMTMLWLNNALYGSAFATGYGPIATLFAIRNVDENASNFARSVLATQNVIPALALLAPFVFHGVRRRGALLLLGFATLVVAVYLPYSPFPEWWYLRFLIPALVVLLILASATGVHLLGKGRMAGVIPIAAVVLGILGTRAAGERQAFELQRLEARYRETAELVRDRLPSNAVVVTEWESGSVRFHGQREVVLWESLDPDWFDRALAWLRTKGLQPYVLVERREEPAFRARFRGRSDVGALDWPPRFDVNRQVRIFDPADRARYLAGEIYPTENTRPPNRFGR